MKKLSDYFTIRNIVLYIVVSVCVGLFFAIPIVLVEVLKPNNLVFESWIETVLITTILISFVFIFVLALSLYGLKKLLLSQTGKMRDIIRLIYSISISVIGGLIISFVILETLPIEFKIVCFLVTAGILYVISSLFFKRIQDKESGERYYKY